MAFKKGFVFGKPAEPLRPIEIRVKKRTLFNTDAHITAVWPGVDNVTQHSTADWKTFLLRRGWDKIPRVWEPSI